MDPRFQPQRSVPASPQTVAGTDRLWPSSKTRGTPTLPERRLPADPARRRNPIGGLALWALNFSVAAISLILLSPLLVLIAIAIKLDSPGPVLYRQMRVGLDRRDGSPDQPVDRRAADRALERVEIDGMDRRLDESSSGPRRADDVGGRPFLIYKFRTMHVDAEEQTGPVWAAATDSRTTRLGRLLRRYRLDEIPQFWNVCRGESGKGTRCV